MPGTDLSLAHACLSWRIHLTLCSRFALKEAQSSPGVIQLPLKSHVNLCRRVELENDGPAHRDYPYEFHTWDAAFDRKA